MSKDFVHRSYADFQALMPAVSGNDVNGLNADGPARPRPFFWHPPDRQDFGDLQQAVIGHHRQSPDVEKTYSRAADRGPRPIEQAATRQDRSAAEWDEAVRAFALANDGDLVGVTATRPNYVYQGYDIPHPWLVMIGVAMDYDNLATAPNTIDDVRSAVEVGDKYNKAARACRKLANFILDAGYEAKTYPGPMATALNMIPAAIEAGLGELGKHGSMINRTYGSSFRLSAVSTDMPLIGNRSEQFGADDFCMNCQVCAKACPPDAIAADKQTVRGQTKWYVDFDKCIPYFGETFACGICLAVCPWSRPGVAPRLAEKMTRRRERLAEQG